MKLFKRILKSERGQALPIALILLALGGFLVVPTLSLMTTSLTANRVVDRANLELYSADAGVEKVLWNIQYNQYDPQNNPTGFTLPMDGDLPTLIPMDPINGTTVTAQMSKEAGQPHKITSTATSPDGHETTVECYTNAQADLSWFFDSAITSANDVTIKPGTEITGDVVYGDDLNNQGEIDGDTIYAPDLEDNWPSSAYLSSFYYYQVAGLTPYPSNEITISGTQANPTLIGPLYRNGDLTFKGSGWARLDGIVYVTGTLTVNPTGGCTIDLNGKTFFSAYYNNCSGDAIYIGPKTTLWGSGCIIAVGNILLQPNLSAGDKLIGVDSDSSTSSSAVASTFLLSKFTADKTGSVEVFRVKCSDSGNVKVAMYADSAGSPGALLNAVNESKPVASGWNDITFPKTDVTSGTNYWLAANADSAIIYYHSTTWSSKTKAAPYSGFTFPSPAGTGFTDVPTRKYLFAGHGPPPFVFIMSINCNSDIKPNGTLYGSIAGNAEVELFPNCTLTLTEVPDDGLNFPGMDAGDDGVIGSHAEILTYTIEH